MAALPKRFFIGSATECLPIRPCDSKSVRVVAPLTGVGERST
jgi:hypothetical protein